MGRCAATKFGFCQQCLWWQGAVHQTIARDAFQKRRNIGNIGDNQYIQLQQDYLTTKAQLQNAREEYNRQKELNQSKVKASSDKVFQQAQADYRILEVSLAALEQNTTHSYQSQSNIRQ